MPDIRTKENLKTSVATIDRAAELAKKIKSGVVQTEETAETTVDPKESNPADYASQKVENGVNYDSQTVAVKSQQIGERSFEQAKIGITNLHQRISEKRRGSQSYHRSPTNTAKNPIRSVQENAKHSIRTSKQAAKAAKKSAKNTEKSAKTAEESVRTSVKVTKAAVKRIHRIIKAIISGIKDLIAACVSGGWVALVIILIIGMVALMICSSYGIFFSGEDSGTGMTMRTAVSQINADYYSQIETRKTSNVHDELKMSGDRAAWKEVLAVYAVKLSMDLYEPQEVATMDQHKAALLKCVFWDMHTITSYVTTRSETEIVSYTDEHGRVIPTEQVRTIRTLHIIVSHLSVDTMASRYHFTAEQKETLHDLLSEEFSTMWAAVLRGISSSNLDIVNVAREQIGNIGGQPYWSWYGFPSRVEWCCCFVSWCANECGYIEQGIIPMYSVVDDGANWFKARGQWLDGSEEPQAGMIIFFDWAYDGLGDGGDHTGIVEKVENGMVYTIEGNSGDACREKSYPIGYYEILGYGAPKY